MGADPEDRTILAVILDLPDAGCRLDEGLIAVVVELRRETINRRVLIEVVRRVDGICAALRRGLTVADVVEGIGVAVVGVVEVTVGIEILCRETE